MKYRRWIYIYQSGYSIEQVKQEEQYSTALVTYICGQPMALVFVYLPYYGDGSLSMKNMTRLVQKKILPYIYSGES
jgi:hypothetical protein